jgi:hypothetical protein
MTTAIFKREFSFINRSALGIRRKTEDTKQTGKLLKEILTFSENYTSSRLIQSL